jgi:hypothetical protein
LFFINSLIIVATLILKSLLSSLVGALSKGGILPLFEKEGRGEIF